MYQILDVQIGRKMAVLRVKASQSKPASSPAVETRESIEAQIAAFLKGGGEIQQIARGVSGQAPGVVSKQITISRK
jgi:hypothetical protein